MGCCLICFVVFVFFVLCLFLFPFTIKKYNNVWLFSGAFSADQSSCCLRVNFASNDPDRHLFESDPAALCPDPPPRLSCKNISKVTTEISGDSQMMRGTIVTVPLCQPRGTAQCWLMSRGQGLNRSELPFQQRWAAGNFWMKESGKAISVNHVERADLWSVLRLPWLFVCLTEEMCQSN